MGAVQGKNSNSILQSILAADEKRRKDILERAEEKLVVEIEHLNKIFYSLQHISDLKKLEVKLDDLRQQYFDMQREQFNDARKRYEEQHKLSADSIIKEMWAQLEKQFSRMLDLLKQSLNQLNHLIASIKRKIESIDVEIAFLSKRRAEKIELGLAHIEKEIIHRYREPYKIGTKEHHFGKYLIHLLQPDFDAYRSEKISQIELASRVEEREKSGFLAFMRENKISEPVVQKDMLLQHKNAIHSNSPIRHIIEQNTHFLSIDEDKKINELLKEKAALIVEIEALEKKKEVLLAHEDSFEKPIDIINTTSPPSSIELLLEIAAPLIAPIEAVTTEAAKTEPVVELDDFLIEVDEVKTDDPLSPSPRPR